MTALTQFQRLEASGLWREYPGAQRRDVIVSFGDASLVIADMREVALTHWSLAAVRRVNPGESPALYAPGPEDSELLEIDDDVMIDAIAKVMTAIERQRPRPGRLRLVLLGASVALVVAMLLFWLPGALRRHTVSVVPPSVRAEIGQSLLRQISTLSGAPCSAPAGNRALARLSQKLTGLGNGVVVLPGGITVSNHLPGGTILLNRALVEDYEDADIVAGFILAETERMAAQDPLDRLLRQAGTIASFRLLTTGTLPDKALAKHAHSLVAAQPAPVDDAALLARFAEAQVPSTPYAYAVDISGETTLSLIEADPMRGQSRLPVISDSDWVRVQGICGG
ncbi:hypothetical protein [Actibacterium sp. XHP0104]|uniref:hypothetical protein n=1 Tax=Actibacterium sp. XHP0104 TaxID=2984335 RepID=UPI0021E96B6D|nr:hypothetical protein [Actibacterium sp. XHP0104]MCV2882905.1 hypothetical protein [Actibacterium sp. XHP0104]